MRRRPLRKISCHPFLKIFVNLVSSVCGFISTCINVSSLVTQPQYLGEDIIKNVWGVGVGAGGEGEVGMCSERGGRLAAAAAKESVHHERRDRAPNETYSFVFFGKGKGEVFLPLATSPLGASQTAWEAMTNVLRTPVFLFLSRWLVSAEVRIRRNLSKWHNQNAGLL